MSKKLYITDSEYKAFREAVEQCRGDLEASESESFNKSMTKVLKKFNQVDTRRNKLLAKKRNP